MRLRPLPPPGGAELRLLPVHELVRDYPELRGALEGGGVSLSRDGGEPLAVDFETLGGSDGLLTLLAWREEGP
jgi:hypothetical protein